MLPMVVKITPTISVLNAPKWELSIQTSGD
jgi:hypothetical protein